MHRTLSLLAAAALISACADQPLAPSRSMQPTSAERALGNPPPPPVARSGFGEFDAFLEDNSEMACAAHNSFTFTYEYLVNKPVTNAFLHIHVDGEKSNVTVHQTEKKIDANGTLVGPGFTFDIDKVIAGSIIGVEEHIPASAYLQLTGKLTTETGTCTANATLALQLTNSDIIP